MIKRSLQYIIGYAISIVVAVFVIVFSINEGGFTFENDAVKVKSTVENEVTKIKITFKITII